MAHSVRGTKRLHIFIRPPFLRAMSQYMGKDKEEEGEEEISNSLTTPVSSRRRPHYKSGQSMSRVHCPRLFSLHRSGKRTLVFACVPSWMTVLCAFGERFRFVSALPKRRKEGGGGVSLGHLGVPILNAKKGGGGRGTIPHVIPREEAKKRREG